MTVYVAEEVLAYEPGTLHDIFLSKDAALAWLTRVSGRREITFIPERVQYGRRERAYWITEEGCYQVTVVETIV